MTPSLPLCSVIIPTFNAIGATRICLQSLFLNTSYPFELIVVDNGSSDGTPEYLLSERDRIRTAIENQQTDCRYHTVILNEKNLGFAKACNQGILAAKGEYILLLNSDTAVTKDWLNRLMTICIHASAIGILQPLSRGNGILHELVEPEKRGAEINARLAFIRSVSQILHNNTREVDLLNEKAWGLYGDETLRMKAVTGFCMLIPRTVINQAGMLDEEFEIGLFEDFDLCRRIRLAGYDIRLAIGVYIHHFVSGSFNVNRIDMSAVENRNRSYFNQKWGRFEKMGGKTRIDIRMDASQMRFPTVNNGILINTIRIMGQPDGNHRASVFLHPDSTLEECCIELAVVSQDRRYFDLTPSPALPPRIRDAWINGRLKPLCMDAVWESLQFKLIHFPSLKELVIRLQK